MISASTANKTTFSEQVFTEQDVLIHRRTISRRWWNLLLTFVVLWSIYGLALFVDEVRQHCQFAMLPFLIPSTFFLGLTIPGFVRLYKDGKIRIKLCGYFIVETAVYDGDKSTTYNLFIVVEGKRRKVRIKKAELEQVQSGIKTYIEFSKYANTIFRFSQDGREVVFRQI